MSTFADHFSSNAAGYARFRPRYPARLFDELTARLPDKATAWDCATGNGQAAVALAESIEQVFATDASPEQISHAQPHPRVDYRVAPAEHSGLDAASVDLVTVAQALHWFDLNAFYSEVKRVLRPGGLLAVWCYGPPELDSNPLQNRLSHYYQDVLGPYWPPERRLVEEGYRSLSFPFEELAAPKLSMSADFNLDELLGYLGTWSATLRYRQAEGHDPLADLKARLLPDWGETNHRRKLVWPLAVRLGVHSAMCQ